MESDSSKLTATDGFIFIPKDIQIIEHGRPFNQTFYNIKIEE
jgi:hypothetical protein